MKDKSAIALIVLLILIGISNAINAAEAPSFSLAKQIGVDGWGKWDAAYGLAADSIGNIIVSGYASDTITFGEITLPDGDHFIVKYDGNGNELWANRTSTTGYAGAYEITTDSLGSIIATGFFNGTITFDEITLTSQGESDIFITKYDENGNLLWVKQAGGLYGDDARGIATDKSNNIIVVGKFVDTVSFGSTTLSSNGGADIFIAKYGPNGNLLWAQQAGGLWTDLANGVALDSSDNIIVTGSFETSAYFGEIRIQGGTAQYSFFIAKYDKHGNAVWARAAGGVLWETYRNEGYSLAIRHSSDDIIVVGWFHGPIIFANTTLTGSDGFIAGYNSAGEAGWARKCSWGKKSNNIGNFVAMDTLDNYSTLEVSVFDGFVIFSYTQGWQKVVADSHVDSVYMGKNIITDAADNIVVIGQFKGNITFDDITFTTSGEDFDYDIFVAKLGDKRRLVTKVIGGHGSISPGSGTYNNGTTVALTATPDADYQVKAWTGTNDDSTTNITNMVTMNNNKLVTVEFELIIGDPDLDGNLQVDFVDFAMFAGKWEAENCDMSDWCDGADFNKDGYVDFTDLEAFANHWLDDYTH